jgi:hypothetical protein
MEDGSLRSTISITINESFYTENWHVSSRHGCAFAQPCSAENTSLIAVTPL